MSSDDQNQRVVSAECEKCGIAGLFVCAPGEPIVCEEGCEEVDWDSEEEDYCPSCEDNHSSESLTE